MKSLELPHVKDAIEVLKSEGITLCTDGVVTNGVTFKKRLSDGSNISSGKISTTNTEWIKIELYGLTLPHIECHSIMVLSICVAHCQERAKMKLPRRMLFSATLKLELQASQTFREITSNYKVTEKSMTINPSPL